MKIISRKKDGRILGAQCIGDGDVSKRIDTLATAMALKANVFQFSTIDFGYSPFYSTAIDASTVAANIIDDKQKGLFKGINSINAQKLCRDSNTIWVDLRQYEHYAKGTIRGAKSIPLESLRGRIKELPRNKRIIFFCDMGNRSYEALRIAISYGYKKCFVLEGGITAWPYPIHGNV